MLLLRSNDLVVSVLDSKPGGPGCQTTDGSKSNWANRPSEVRQMSTSESWELNH